MHPIYSFKNIESVTCIQLLDAHLDVLFKIRLLNLLALPTFTP